MKIWIKKWSSSTQRKTLLWPKSNKISPSKYHHKWDSTEEGRYQGPGDTGGEMLGLSQLRALLVFCGFLVSVKGNSGNTVLGSSLGWAKPNRAKRWAGGVEK